MGFLETFYEIIDFDPVVSKARNKEWAGDLDGAIAVLRQAIDARGATARRLDALAGVSIKKGDYAEALKYADQAIAAGKPKTKYQATRGRALRRLGRLDEALPLLEAHFQRDKMDIFNSSELCELLVDMGRASDAVPIYRDMEARFGAEAGSALANKIGMTQAYESAKSRLAQAGTI